jgi:tetraacyldisaccharide 4'-kinase
VKAAVALYSRASCLATRAKNTLYDRTWLKPRRAPLPVISVGSLALGGMGKTPLASEILGHFLDRGRRPALVSRGYKGAWESHGGVLSDGHKIFGSWQQAGDEPALVALRFPEAGVFVGKNRYLSCLRAKAKGFDLAVLDDGFQHRKLFRDLDIALYDPAERLALREPLAALGRAHIILIQEGSLPAVKENVRARFSQAKVLGYSVIPLEFLRTGTAERLPLGQLEKSKALALCGIARPERFFTMLEGLGVHLLGRMAFPDHHAYPERSWRSIMDRVKFLKPETLVTTEKDAVKLAGRSLPESTPPLYALRIGLSLDREFYEALDSALLPGEQE